MNPTIKRKFRAARRSTENIVHLLLEGGAVVSGEERDALLEEIPVLRQMLDRMENGLAKEGRRS